MIHFDNLEHAHRIAKGAGGCLFHEGVDTSISRVGKDDKLMGGVIYKEFTGASIEMHCVGFVPNWGSRDLLWVVFDYPFSQLGCSRVFAKIPSGNSRAIAFDYKLGFKYVTTIPGVYLDGDLVVLAMDRVDCRWLQIKPRTLSRRA